MSYDYEEAVDDLLRKNDHVVIRADADGGLKVLVFDDEGLKVAKGRGQSLEDAFEDALESLE